MIVSCKNNEQIQIQKRSNSKILITSWNLQTFFDSVECGNEFSEFTGSKSKWSKEKYLDRLQRLCSIIEQTDADIFVMQEIENDGIIYDIINNLSQQGRSDKAYNYAAFSLETNQAFGCAVISRYEISVSTIHQIDIRTQEISQPDMRALLEVNLLIDDKLLKLFVCHWKSKSGGEGNTEVWRNYQEKILADRILCNSKNNVVICGDFNRDVNDFDIVNQKVVLHGSNEDIHVNSAWLNSKINKENENLLGSYYYQSSWEKIDNFFYNDKIIVNDFIVFTSGGNTTEAGFPFRYSVWNGQGYSDHLPICCVLSF